MEQSTNSKKNKRKVVRDPEFDQEFIKKLEYLYIVSKKIVAGRQYAKRKTRIVGSGMEFADFRPYSEGDDLRNIDWNIYARTEKLFLKLFEEEEDHHIYFLLDTSRSMQLGHSEGRISKWDYAKRVAAALGYVGLANQDIVSIVPFSEALKTRMPPTKGKGQVFKILDFLSIAEPGKETHMTDAFRSFVQQNKRPGIAVVISDFYDPDGYEEALNYLRYQRFEPILIQLYDERELNPKMRGELELVDCETDQITTLVLNESLMQAYRREWLAFSEKIESFSTQKQMLYFRTPIQMAFDELILRVFRAGGFIS